MSAEARTTRRWLSASLALLVLAKMQHCMWEEGLEMRQQFNIAACRQAGRPAPIEPQRHDCDHESGCICRGATLVHSADVSHLKGSETARLPADFALAPLGWTTDLVSGAAADLAPADIFIAPSLSGRQLRALYASLVI